MLTSVRSLGMFSFTAAALAAACGPQIPTEVPPQPTATAIAATTGAATSSAAPATAVPPATATGAPPATATVAPPKGRGSIPLSASTMRADIAKLGIDINRAGRLEKMKSADKKQIMPLFQKALGYAECTGCHAPGKDPNTPIDVTIDTHNMKMARGMWNNFVVKLRDAHGAAIFCDSCHTAASGGTDHLLDRTDKDALQKFMEENYDAKLARADKQEHNCSTCHGDPFEANIFTKLWKIDDSTGHKH